MNILCNSPKTEISVKNSRFIAQAFSAESPESAKEIVRSQKERYKDARHIVHAFIVGANAEISGMSDDGEPSGTAGRPILDVLKGSGITNILITVVRYFGGTLLGTGGLCRAYSESAKNVISLCHTELLVEKLRFELTADYALYEGLKRLWKNFHLSDLTENFDSQVRVSGFLWKNESEDFFLNTKNFSKGMCTVKFFD